MERPCGQTFQIRRIPGRFAIVQLESSAGIPDWATHGAISATVRTAGELSLVCDETVVPSESRAERGWVALALEGPLPFVMTGVLASLLAPLAEAGIPVFVLSTFDTDIVLIKGDQEMLAITVLEGEGHTICC